MKLWLAFHGNIPRILLEHVYISPYFIEPVMYAQSETENVRKCEGIVGAIVQAHNVPVESYGAIVMDNIPRARRACNAVFSCLVVRKYVHALVFSVPAFFVPILCMRVTNPRETKKARPYCRRP